MKKALIITAVFIGIFFALQIRSFQKVQSLVERLSPANVFAELRTFQVANSQLRTHLAEEEATFADTQSKISSVSLEDEIAKLRLMSGEDDVFGAGIEVTISGPIEEFWISDLVAQLVAAGAEAVSVNDVRITDKTAGFRSIGNGILMRSYFFNPPFRISAVGPSKELKQTIAQNGGILDRIQNTHQKLAILVSEKDKIIIPALGKN